MASQPSALPEPRSLSDLTVRDAQGDLLDADPLQFGPGAPASTALALERGPQPADARQRGE